MQNELNSNVARCNQLTHESCFHDTMCLVRVKVALTFPFETVCYRPSDFFSKTSNPVVTLQPNSNGQTCSNAKYSQMEPRCFSQQVTMVTFIYSWPWELMIFKPRLRFKPR